MDYDQVKHPKHYKAYPVEVIDMIKAVLTEEQFIGFCFGNVMKYRMRAGMKDALEQDIAKADFYLDLLRGEDPR